MTRADDRRTVLSRVADEAETLAEQLRFYEDCVGRAAMDRSYDYAIHMTDPTANADDFDREFDEYVEGMEASLAETNSQIERFVAVHRDELLELAAFGRPDADPMADEFVPVVDRGVWR